MLFKFAGTVPNYLKGMLTDRAAGLSVGIERPIRGPFFFNRGYAVAELQDQFNFSASPKVRTGRVIGRCHAALGEHALSVSAFDAAIELARRGRFLLSEALAIRDRALAGQVVGENELHWDERNARGSSDWLR